MKERGLLVKDLGSTNGTWIGGVRVNEGYLVPGMECRLGDALLTFGESLEERHGLVAADRSLGQIVGASEAMRELYGLVRAVAPTAATVLITGESGTGKELVARTIHDMSARKAPLVVFDAAATDPDLVRCELFGHVRGAFTGATEARQGAFRRAHGGTLFIDEIGELPLDLQPRLLRVLETREVTPVGSDESVAVDVRVVAATNRDLVEMVREGRFREDLYHRIAVVGVHVPALRDRAEDIPLLVERISARLGLSCRFSPEALETLARHPWPGNVRSLKNALERAGVLRAAQEVRPEHLALPLPEPGGGSIGLANLEREAIERALELHGCNRQAAARELGISLSTLKRRLKDYRQQG